MAPSWEINRRDFFRVSGKAALAAGFGSLIGLHSNLLFARDGESEDCGDVALTGLELGGANARRAGEPDGDYFERIKPLFQRRFREAIGAVDDLAWAVPGAKVAIKIASNSPKAYPKTTHPLLLEETIKMLTERGCDVAVADHPGGEWIAPALFENDEITEKVRRVFGAGHRLIFGDGTHSGDEVMRMNGLYKVATDAGARWISLDGASEADSPGEFDGSQTWVWVKPGRDEGVVSPSRVWPDGFRAARAFFEVDHVVNLARPSGHIMAGHTGPLKNWYGWLHIADRLKSHGDGFFFPLKLDLLRKKQRWWGWLGDFFPPTDIDEVPHLHESIAEVAAFFDQKVQLNISAAVETFADVGPDWGQAPLENSFIMAGKDLGSIDSAFAAHVAYEKNRLGEEARRETWQRDPEVSDWTRRFRQWTFGTPETLRDETFFGEIEGLVHRKHGSHMARELIEEGTSKGHTVWDTRMLAHLVKNGGTDCTNLKINGAPLPPTLVEGLKEFGKASVRQAPGMEDALREGMREGQNEKK